MPFRITIQNSKQKSIAGTVIFLDGAGNPINKQTIPAGGAVLVQSALDSAFGITVTAPGYYDTSQPKGNLYAAGSNDLYFELQEKPKTVTWFLAGAATAVLLAIYFKNQD